MNKKYLMNGFAALALIASVSSCTKDVTTMSQSEIDSKAKENAELQLGFTIPDGQSWVMASQVTANVAVNGDYGTNYTVTIYENNPFTSDNTGVVLGSAEVKSGDVATFDFTCPNEAEMVFAAIKDEKGYTYVKPVAVKDGKVEAVFGDEAAGSRAMRAASATNSHVDIPTCTVTNAYVQSFLEGAKEPTDANVVDNYDDGYNSEGSAGNYGGFNWKNDAGAYLGNWWTISEEDAAWFEANCRELANWSNWNTNDKDGIRAYYNLFWEVYNKCQNTGRDWMNVYTWPNLPTEGGWVADETYVTKFKITGTWNKLIDVLPTEEGNGDARTVYVSGTWTIPAGKEQRVGGGAVVVIVAGGEIVVPEGSQLNFVNQARLVNAGGTISGAGTINVTNGVEAGKEGYNSGTISVGKFNQNFGTFFNYGTFRGTELNGGAGTSTFVNRGHMYISGAPKGSNSANLQIKNNCWFEATGEVAGKLIENASGAYFKAGALDLSSSEGGEGIGTYIAMDTNSSMVITGAVKLNGTLIYGPTSGESAYLEYDNINFLNVGETYPINGKLNVYVGGFTGQNASGYEEHWNINMAAGDGKPQVVGKAAFNTASTDASDCAPAFTPNIPEVVYETLKVYTYAFEDQTVNTDYDMNDVVLKVNYHVTEQGTGANAGKVIYDKTKLDVKLVAAGATFNIKVKIGDTYLFGGKEIHDALNVNAGVMVNTGSGSQTANPAVENGISIPAGWNGDFTRLPVSIEVLSTSTTYVFPNTDLYPHAVMVPTDWAWPQERVNVQVAYPGTSSAPKVTIGNVEVPNNSFRAWGGTPAANRTSAMNGWYNNPASGKVMSNN